MSDNQNNNSWNEWSKYVLKELERLNGNVEDLAEKIQEVRIEIGMLKVKSSLVSAIGGAIPVIIGLGIYFLTRN